MCAPVRDEKIKQLTETTDVVETFKGILEVCVKIVSFKSVIVLIINSLDVRSHEIGHGKLHFGHD